MPCSDANARTYSDQLNFKGAGLHGGLIPVPFDMYGNGDPEDTWEVLPERTFEGGHFAANCCVTVTEHGMQTGASLAAHYKVLTMELKANGVEFPVVITTDGHSSRMSAEVEGDDEETTPKLIADYQEEDNYPFLYGGDLVCTVHTLRQWIDMGDCSAFRQMWDQRFGEFHQEYIRFKKVLVRAEEGQGRQLKFTAATVLFILHLIHGDNGPTWSNPSRVMEAWRSVMISRRGLWQELNLQIRVHIVRVGPTSVGLEPRTSQKHV
jgi:hypothetical protein